jgi:hypothetical protein
MYDEAVKKIKSEIFECYISCVGCSFTSWDNPRLLSCHVECTCGKEWEIPYKYLTHDPLFAEYLKTFRNGTMIMPYQDEIKQHLSECEEFDGNLRYQVEPISQSYSIYCTCKKHFTAYPNSKREEKEIKTFCEAAKMFPRVPRQNAVELDEVIDPILGFCVDYMDLEGF